MRFFSLDGHSEIALLSLTRKTDYALLALAEMVRTGARCTSARDMSGRLGVPVRVLTVVLNRLTHKGLVVSVRGTRGGYSLARAPEDITVAALIEAIEGPLRLTRCCLDEEHQDDQACGCEMEESCGNKVPVRKLHASLRRFFDRVTLRDIVCDTIPLTVGDAVTNDTRGCGTVRIG